MTTWSRKLTECGCADLLAVCEENNDGKQPFDGMEWDPGEADKSAAWLLYSELRTRITTQPLAHLHGDEATALKSIYDIFELTRNAIKEHKGCTHFATLTVFVLNVHVRPFTAYWHKVKLAGRLTSSDTCHRFRQELVHLQKKLRLFMSLLGHMAEGDGFVPGTESGTETSRVYHDYELGRAIPFGVAGSCLAIENATDIDAAEREEIIARRKTYGFSEKPEDAFGIAISGGGIRSATFSLGVVQHLARKGILKAADFVSTVSGGGYLGSFISSYLNDPENPNASIDPPAASSSDPGEKRHCWPFGKLGDGESKAVRHLRNHSNYIVEGGFRTIALILGQMLYGIAVNLILTLPVVLLAVFIAHYVLGDEFAKAVAGDPIGYPPESTKFATWLVLGLLMGSVIVLPILQNVARHAGLARQKLRECISRFEIGWCVSLLIALAALLVFNALPHGFRLYHDLVHGTAGETAIGTVSGGESREFWGVLIPVVAALLPFLAGVLTFFVRNAAIMKKIVMTLLVISGPVFFLSAFFVASDVFFIREGEMNIFNWEIGRTAVFWILFVTVAIYGGLLLNINFTSPHRYYRRQLSRTYLRKAKNGMEETEHDDTQSLSGLNRRSKAGQSKAPYQLINCALNIPACDDPNLRGRASDFFVFSKHYCGSPIAGYARTEDWEAIDGHLNLGTAMAISSAAASPQMGTNSVGGIGYLLAMLNIRLNYWVAVPRTKDGVETPRWLTALRSWRTPGFLYFFKELTGLLMNEKGSFLNLSDGGHVENLALYELLRRRCKFIVAINGEADPERTSGGLLTLVRLAKIDLNIDIDPDLEQMRIDEHGNSKSHFQLCEIDYGQGMHGLLLYIQSSVTGNESEFLQKYRQENPAFPHESTADQLFDESQFEAYRALGEHVGNELFRSDLVEPIQPNGTPFPEQPEVREWFQGLANSMLQRPPAERSAVASDSS